MKIEYRINGERFEDYGVYVSASSVLIGALKPRSRVQVEWEDENGYAIDSDADIVFYARSIVLSCFLVANNTDDMLGKINAFTGLFCNKGMLDLEISLGEKKLSYKVVLIDKIDVDKKFTEGRIVATFTLKLEEPNPSV